MRIAIYLATLLPAFASAATIEGAFFRLDDPKLVLDKTAVRGTSPIVATRKMSDLVFSNIDYHLHLNGVLVFVREGAVDPVDPQTMNASQLFTHEEERGDLRVFTVVCRYENEFAVGVMISSQSSTPSPEGIRSGVYFSIRSPDSRIGSGLGDWG